MACHQREAIIFFFPQGFLTFMGFNAKLQELNPFSHNYDIDFIQNLMSMPF
jgi:hypothetical protein